MGKPLAAVRVGTKGRVYLPSEVRELLRIEEGDHLVFREDRGRVYVEKLV